jgi:hypothetical protein
MARRFLKKWLRSNPDSSIDVIASVQDVDIKNFDPAGTKELYYELMPNGFISQLNEN